MVLFKGWRTKKLVAHCIELLSEGRMDEAFVALREQARDLGPAPFTRLASAMVEAERPQVAARAIEAALELDPANRDALVIKADLLALAGDEEGLLAVYRRVCELDPKDQAAAVALAELLGEREEFPEIVSALEGFRGTLQMRTAFHLGRGYLLVDRTEEAAELLGDVVEELERSLRQAMSHAEFDALKEELQEATQWHEEAVSIAFGREECINLAAARGRLDAGAGVNYTLLGHRLMVDSPRVAECLELRSIAEDLEEARRLHSQDPHDPRGLRLRGICELREGKHDVARALFEKATAANRKDFAAFLGLGAAIDTGRFGLFKKAKALPMLPPDERMGPVVPDWSKLNALERRVVLSSVHPLRGGLVRLAALGAHIRVLPLDVRATDLPDLAELEGRRGEDDHRSYAAVTGLASGRLAISKIEDMVDVDSDNGWVFAHELAHLVFRHFEGELFRPVAELLEQAAEAG